MTYLRLLVRRHRLLLSAWPLLLVVLTGATVTAYQDTYATDAQRQAAAELARENAASTLMYGELPEPGTVAQMFAWEVGAITTILAAIAAVLVAVAATRATEDDGTLELVRSTGTDPRTPLRAALVVLVGVASVLAVGSATAVALVGALGGVDAVTSSGAAAFGAVLGATFLLVGTGAVVLAQVAPAAGGARALGLAAVGLAFAVRAIADSQDLRWLNWFSPLGLRATVRPFTDNRWWVLLVALLASAALARLGTALAARREYGAGLVPAPPLRTSRLHVRSSLGLAARLDRRSILIWTVGVASLGTLFSAMGSGVVEQSRDQELDGFLGSQLGTADPVAGYFAYSGTVVGLVVCAYSVLSVSRYDRDETAGRTALILTAGVRRWVPLAAQLGATALGAAIVLTATGLLGALIAPSVFTGSSVATRALGYTLGQWPAAMVMAAVAALLVGCRPRLVWLAWVPLAASGVLALLGELLGIPRAVRDAGIFQHVPDIAGPDPYYGGLALLLAVALVGVVLGLVGATRRDVVAG
ncbi:hypothetical protein [Cryptosporangium minutisporangium]|uniref:Multidrug efflux ABC transporter permease n=1 Tax=Cryptosporangium minutisporangium TaxID=113569 RepID=A0ABP6T9L4_9ACTN